MATSHLDDVDGPSDLGVRLGDVSHLKEVLQQMMKDKKSELGEQNNEDGGAGVSQVLDITSVTAPNLMSKYEWAFEVKETKMPFTELVENPVRTWPFELDSFQKQAIYYLTQGMNVFVAAHTSAGKTVIAEYAIALAERAQGRVVYTSPIKALSNQKFSDFRATFKDVGLITGDLQVNEEARCLIMTTEILRSMLFLGTQQVQDLHFVIFDEVHYINDPERGHVWEEALILLPAEVQIVLLSATVPNAMQFANWLGKAKRRRVAVSKTSLRPVPLHYYLYMGAGHQVIKIKEEDNFLIRQFEAAKQSWEEGKPKGRIPNYKMKNNFWVWLIHFLVKNRWIPAVIFCLSRKKCDALAERACSNNSTDLTTKVEKHKITRFMDSQIARLDEEDQNLRQISNMKKYLERGIAVHHSGILPILKEIVEVLFAKGLVKVLFATETFAVGVNMPAKTVVFEDIYKFDGVEKRLLKPAEFIQMAGRAGRRGQDDFGTVLLLMGNKFPLEHELNAIMMGSPSELISKFRLSYTIILTTLQSKGKLTVADILVKSYMEHGEQSKMSNYRSELEAAKMEEEKAKREVSVLLERKTVELMKTFYKRGLEFLKLWDSIRPKMLSTPKFSKLLVVGRIVIVNRDEYVNVPAIIAKIEVNGQSGEKIFTVIAFVPDKDLIKSFKEDRHKMNNTWLRLSGLVPGVSSMAKVSKGIDSEGSGSSCVFKIGLADIAGIANVKPAKSSIITEGLAERERILKSFKKSQISETFENALIPLFNYQNRSIKGGERIDESQLVITELELQDQLDTLWTMKAEINSLVEPFSNRISPLMFKNCFRWIDLQNLVTDLEFRLSIESMSLYPDYLNKLRVLKSRQYISENDTVELKGNMASRLGKFELLITEILVSNFLADVSCEEVAAALSCLVWHISGDEEPDPKLNEELPESLIKLIERIKGVIKDIQEQERSLGIVELEGAELSKISFNIVKPIYQWAKGMSFGKVMESALNVQEGALVRSIQHLLEVLKVVESAARLMGDPRVPAVVEAASRAIKRGIVFSPSIYTTMKGEDQPVRSSEEEAATEEMATSDDSTDDRGGYYEDVEDDWQY